MLKHHWPTVPNFGDITAVDWATVPPIGIYSGGFPCQDVSAAGKRAGLKHGTRTGLWHHTAHAIDVLRPRWAVLENVLGLLSADGDEWPDSVKELSELAAKWGRVVLLIQRKVEKADRKGTLTAEWLARKDAELVRARREEQRVKAKFTKERLRLVPRAIATVLAALAAEGYDVRWFVCKASDVGAPHHRTRVFIVASREPWAVAAGARPIARLDDEAWTEPDHGLFGTIPFAGPWPHAGCIVDGVAYEVDADRATGTALDVLPTPAASNPNDGEDVETWEARRAMLAERHGNNGAGTPLSVAVRTLPTPTASDADKARDNPAQAARHSPPLSAVSAHFPTPRSSRGGSATETLYALGGVRDNTNRRQGEVVLPTPTAGNATGTNERRGGARGGEMLLPGVAVAAATGELLPTPTATERGDCQSERDRRSPDIRAVSAHFPDGVSWGKYAPAIHRWEALTRPSPAPTEPNRNGRPRLAASFAEWMMGWLPGWVTDPAIGLTRPEQLKIIGNGVVDRQAEHALRTMLSWRDESLAVSA